MSVAKVTEISSSSTKSFEDAITDGIDRANKTLRDVQGWRSAEVCELLRNAPGVELLDGTETGEYPTPVTDASGNDPVYVGRVREDISHPSGINLWIVADNIRKGAALNSVQIAEILAKNYL